MSEEDQAVGVTALPKFDMPSYESEMTSKDVKSLALRRAIPDAMAWRHHDSDVNDPVPEDGFQASDVQLLIERVVDLRPVPLGNVVTMYEYLRFLFLSGASISKGPRLISQDRIEQHTARSLSFDQPIPEKTDHQKEVEVEDPKIRCYSRKKTESCC
ncbi:hypothetical protein Tco_1200568 [Tanacetum coccineum]